MIIFEQLTVEEEVDGKQIIERQAVRRELEIAQDFYALTFCSFIQYYRNKYQITLDERVQYMVNCCLIFLLQSCLLLCVFYFIKKTQEEEVNGFMAMMHVDVLLTRFVLGWLMHMNSEPEVRQAMSMFKYVI